jgi:heme/copper-type cytochrome/quinol oxidase subunit 2
VHGRKSPLVRFAVALLPVSAVVLTVLATGTGVASAADETTQVDAEISSFGLLGPVGLAAVALGVIGMALGVLRQRRKAQAEAQEQAKPAPVPVEDPALAQYRRSV